MQFFLVPVFSHSKAIAYGIYSRQESERDALKHSCYYNKSAKQSSDLSVIHGLLSALFHKLVVNLFAVSYVVGL